MPSILPVQAHRASRTCLPTPAAQATVSTDKQGCRRQACVLRRLGGPLALIISSMMTPALAISPGDLDTNFNAVGVALTQVGTSSRGSDVLIQPDGKIIVVGTGYVAANFDFALVRYNPNGTLDTSFGVGGVVSAGIGSGSDTCYAAALRPDGKIICAGQRGDDLSIGLIRFNANGSIDTSFGSFGRYSIAIAARESYATDIAIQPDGKILLSAHVDNFNGDFRTGLVRLLPDGGLDTGFADGGIASQSIGIGTATTAAVALQPDGRIVVGGQYRSTVNSRDFLLLRYLSNGTLDTGFDGDGIVITPFDSGVSSGDRVADIAVQADGRIVAVGNTNSATFTDLAVARYLANGALDSTFDGDGRAVVNGGTLSEIYAVVVQADGKIVTGGSYFSNPGNNQFLVRHNVDGSLDASFGTGGVRTLSITGNEYTTAMAIQADGKLVAAGTSATGGDRFIVTRFHTEPPTDAIFVNGFEQP